ncbi:Uncharacterised protein [Mycobacteroides abscessus subsp. abscessus]|nr:Uncharacterised protein [Mycobacteroides abscessus subsp. abscessus]
MLFVMNHKQVKGLYRSSIESRMKKHLYVIMGGMFTGGRKRT